MGSVYDWFIDDILGIDPPEPIRVNTNVTQIAEVKPIVNVKTTVDLSPVADSIDKAMNVFARQNTDTLTLIQAQEDSRISEKLFDKQLKNKTLRGEKLKTLSRGKTYFYVGGVILLLLVWKL